MIVTIIIWINTLRFNSICFFFSLLMHWIQSDFLLNHNFLDGRCSFLFFGPCCYFIIVPVFFLLFCFNMFGMRLCFSLSCLNYPHAAENQTCSTLTIYMSWKIQMQFVRSFHILSQSYVMNVWQENRKKLYCLDSFREHERMVVHQHKRH